jgi:hypothetical protein
MRARPAGWASLLIACSLALASGCGDDEDETTPIAPPAGPPTVRITAIRTTSGPSFEVGSGAQAVVEAGCDPRKTVNVDLELGFFTRKPPGACAGIPQCGSLLLTVQGPGGREGSVRSTAISVPVRLSDLDFEAGRYVFTVELQDDAKKPITVPDAVPTDSVTVDIDPPTATGCGPREGGVDASDGEAGDTDAGDAADGNAADTAPDVSDDAAPDATPDASDAAGDHTETDGPADVEQDQG